MTAPALQGVILDLFALFAVVILVGCALVWLDDLIGETP